MKVARSGRGELRVAIRALLRHLLPYCVSVSRADRVRHDLHLSSGVRRRALEWLVRVLRHMSLDGRPPFELVDDPRVRLSSVDTGLTQLLYWYGEGGYESALSGWWRWFVRDAASVLEVGCNIGLFTVIGRHANPVCRYRSVDANLDSCRLLRDNLTLSHARPVEIHHAAVVGDDRTVVSLALPVRELAVAPTMAFVAGMPDSDNELPTKRTLEVPAVRARRLVEDADLVKLDIEGSESSFLRDAGPALEANRATLIVEVLPKAHDLHGVLASMVETSYDAYLPEHGRLRPVKDVGNLPTGSRDLVLVHRGRSLEWVNHFAF